MPQEHVFATLTACLLQVLSLDTNINLQVQVRPAQGQGHACQKEHKHVCDIDIL